MMYMKQLKKGYKTITKQQRVTVYFNSHPYLYYHPLNGSDTVKAVTLFSDSAVIVPP